MFLMRADTLRGEVVGEGGGLTLEISSFVGPCEMARASLILPAILRAPNYVLVRP